jgi:phage-related protein
VGISGVLNRRAIHDRVESPSPVQAAPRAPVIRLCTSPLIGWFSVHLAFAYNFWYTMAESLKKLEVLFFRTDGGNEPVHEWLLSMEKDERKIIGDDVLKVQYCWPIGKPLVGSLGHGLWEVRSRLAGRIARVIFCVEGQTMVLLHAFIKKTQKTPAYELDLALRRKNQLL